MSRILLQQAFIALRSAGRGDGNYHDYSDVADAIEAELAKPEQTIVPFPSFMRKRIEEAIDNAINPKGMSVHDGKATVYASDLQRMIAVIDLAPPRKPWLSLSDNEQYQIVTQCGAMSADWQDFVVAIEAKLKELNT